MIPNSAVDAAVPWVSNFCGRRSIALQGKEAEVLIGYVLEAAAPHMLADAWDETMARAAEIAWEHDGSASSAIKSTPNPYRPNP